jgi:hypothetical protein
MPSVATARKTSKTSDFEDTQLIDDTATLDTEPVTTEPAKPALFKFEILYRGVTLADTRRTSPLAKVVSGDIARLSSGRMVARAHFTDGFAYETFDPMMGCDFGARPTSWESRFQRDIETLQSPSGVRILAPTSFALECAEFRSKYPGISSRLGLEASRPDQIFDPGPTSYPINPPHGIVCVDQIWKYLDQHAAGNWGNHGRMDFTPLTEEELWCIDMLDTNRRNAASVLTGSGPIQSEYTLPDELQSQYRTSLQIQPWRKESGVLKIWTLARGGQNKTIVKIGPSDVSA